MIDFTQKELKQVLHYDHQTGIFRWRYSVANRVNPWDIAGAYSHKYIAIYVKGKRRPAHRLAWFYMTGNWPKNQIDHINGVRDDNRFLNLREATNKENSENSCISVRNTSGFKGVTWDKFCSKWKASVCHNGIQMNLGRYDTAEEAGKVAQAKRAELFTYYIGRDKKSELVKPSAPCKN